jgi:hypothetical protein
MKRIIKGTIALSLLASEVNGFVSMYKIRGVESTQLDLFDNFFKELDSFIDDATNRRLGNGAAFYGKRKSSFYGEEDMMKKVDSDIDDPTEDYQGPRQAGYFKWITDEDGQLRPVTRMKNKNIEKLKKMDD